MIERRKFGRRTVFKRATCVSLDGTKLSCIVVDISPDGARLQLKEGEPSQQFTLLIHDDEVAIPCTIANRITGQIGAQYVGLSRNLTRALKIDPVLRSGGGMTDQRVKPWGTSEPTSLRRASTVRAVPLRSAVFSFLTR